MPYFFVVPAFLVWLLIAGSATLAARSLPSLAPVYPFVWRISLWSTLGFIAGNLVLIALLWLGFAAIGPSPTQPSTAHGAAQVAWVVSALLGPVLVLSMTARRH